MTEQYEIAKEFYNFSNKKTYNSYSLKMGIIEKAFNNGNGSLCAIRFYKNTIVVNDAIINKTDIYKIKSFLEHKNISIPIVHDSLGYPGWYFETI